MCYVIKKMCYQVPGRFFWFNIFLAAYMAKFTLNSGTTIQAIFFFSFL